MHRLSPVGNLELREDVGDVVAHRFRAQDQVGGDVSIGFALGNQGENLVFAVRQLREELCGATLRGWSSAAEVVNQALGDGRTKDGLTARHSTDGAQSLLLHGALEEVAARSSANGGEDGLVILKHREDQNADVRACLQDAARGLNAIDAWHLNIHQNDICSLTHKLAKKGRDVSEEGNGEDMHHILILVPKRNAITFGDSVP